jgi:chitinase
MRRSALLFSAGPAAAAATEALRPAVIAYVFPRDRVLEPFEIRAEKLTHVNFAFANVVGGRVVEGGPNDGPNLTVLTGLRRDHPHLQVLVSVGGWSWSKGFSDAALTVKSRRVFVASAIDFVRRTTSTGSTWTGSIPGSPATGTRTGRRTRRISPPSWRSCARLSTARAPAAAGTSCSPSPPAPPATSSLTPR